MKARFWMKVRVAPSDVCWEWLAVLDRNGYGQFKLDGQMAGAHRVAYQLALGKIPDGLELDHLCRNPACVNPSHLEPVTGLENWRRGRAISVFHSIKTHCPAGHPYDNANTYMAPGRHRNCRACNRGAVARYKARKRIGATS